MPEPVDFNQHITGCARWVRNGGACALPAGHPGPCNPIENTGPAAEPWPPTDRLSTAQELADTVAIANEDGTYSWSPLATDGPDAD